MSLDFIDIDHINGFKSHFSINGKKQTPGTLRISGVLCHNEEITFSRSEAEKLVKFLNENILNKGAKNESV